ncbi:MAG TPA: FHA domain-containing protein [Thermoanaerobaculia bacterium]|nr:FHA domain-containing protein [Thermoanaerobaculia bacterium]
MRYRFGDFEFDSYRLTRRGALAGLTPKAAALLETLLIAAPSAVSKEAIYERLWRDVVVEDGNLHNLISELRAVLGDDDHQIIATVHRKGYAFVAPLERTRTTRLEIGDESIDLTDGQNIIGRDLVGTPDVSRYHARIDIDGSHISIEDLASKNGTFVNGERIHDRVALKDGDQIVFGRTRAVVRVVDASAPTVTVT